ncbi:MAG TPA: hypothetical protein VNH44_01595 [Micropepsaceae bacterium]|nr:hypothetical protein [Micropepsaceae bacterium]
MTAFNVVRFRVKPGREQDFIDAHRSANAEGFTGARRFVLIRTGDSTFCAVGEWDTFDHIVNARSQMIGLLDGFRDMLEVLGESGVTDPVSGEAVLEMGPPAKKARRAGVAKRKPANKARATSARPGKPAPKKKAAAKPGKKKAAKKPTKAKRRR